MKEEISSHLEKNIGYWQVQINGNKFATGQIQGKPVEVVKGQILAG
jgi:nucleoside phosphorylase